MRKVKNIFEIFGKPKALIGMVHLKPMPGTPYYNSPFRTVITQALKEAEILVRAGVDSVMIENMHDRPYLKKKVGPEVVAAMSVVAYELRKNFDLPIGVQTLAGANKEALSIAKAAGLDFVRAEGFVFAHVADEGFFQSDAGELLRFRKLIDAENILIFADIKKKHSSHSITKDVSLKETAEAADFFLADGVIITGKSTGKEPELKELKNLYGSLNLPIIIGSGINTDNISRFIDFADAFIVGSYFKKDGKWFNPVEEKRVVDFVNKFNKLRHH